ncbi:putative glycolipid-binding domain-containing protein [Streptomyces sp. NPDC093093]|uniref:putative glycolipid-binding domain-containing protein n=1 Tax=Streptomyces sp. NPDC093093 TaxID=3366025 RepID=UPI0037F92FEC
MDDSAHFTRTWQVTASGGYDTAWGRFEEDRLQARGRALGLEDGPYWVTYRLVTGPRFVTRELHVTVDGPGAARRELDLRRDEAGRWTVDGQPREEFEGALDCDLGVCPLTNTMPVLRHGLHLRDAGAPERPFLMAWVSVPDLVVTPSEQVYTPLGGHRVRYASGSFTADVEFDADGLVRHYPGLATGLHAGPEGSAS